MQIIVLIVFAVVLSFGAPGGFRIAPEAIGWGALAGALAFYVAAAVAMTWWLTRRGLQRLMAGGAFGATVHRQRRRLTLVGLWLIAGMVALVLVGATDRLRELPGAATIPLADEVMILGVFFVTMVAYWRISFQFDRAVRWQLEQDLFIAVPIGLIVLAHEAAELLAPLTVPATIVGVKAVAVGGVFFASPALLVRVWRTRPMPDGELRRRLERLCRKINLKYRRILIWDTGGVLANAGVMGLHRSVRYILISDALLEQMDDRQIVAVFGHEAGHVKHHHMGYFLVFIVAMMLGCMGVVSAGGLLAERIGVAETWVLVGEQVAMAAFVLLAVGLGFGWLSRRFERQADVYGAWCAGLDAEIEDGTTAPAGDLRVGGPWFVAALESIARLNGLPRDGHNWRHGSIASRVQFLRDWIARGRSRNDFDRGVSRVRRIGWVVAAVAMVAAAATWPRWW